MHLHIAREHNTSNYYTDKSLHFSRAYTNIFTSLCVTANSLKHRHSKYARFTTPNGIFTLFVYKYIFPSYTHFYILLLNVYFHVNTYVGLYIVYLPICFRFINKIITFTYAYIYTTLQIDINVYCYLCSTQSAYHNKRKKKQRLAPTYPISECRQYCVIFKYFSCKLYSYFLQ